MSIDFDTPAATSLTIHPEPQSSLRKPIQKATLGDNGQGQFWGKDGFTFDDVLDMVNPLQHIPGLSHLYQAATGDTIAAGPRLIGGGILGGVTGFLASAAETLFVQQSGASVGEQAVAALSAPQQPVTETPRLPVATAVTPASALNSLPELTALPALPEVPQRATTDRHAAILDLFAAEEQTLTRQVAPASSLIAAQEMAGKL